MHILFMTTSNILKGHLLFFILIQALLTSLLLRVDVNPTIVRVAYLPSETVMTHLSPYGPGFDYELVRLFCTQQGLSPIWLPVHSAHQGFDALKNNRADILIHSIDQTALSLLPDLQTSPVYRVDHPIIVHNKWKWGILHTEDLCQDTLIVSSDTGVLNYVRTLIHSLKCTDTKIQTMGPGLEPLLTSVTRNRSRFAVVRASEFKLWQPFFPEIRHSLDLPQPLGSVCSWRTTHKKLAASLRTFWATVPSSRFFQEIKARYFGFFPSQTDFYDLDHMLKVIDKKLPRYNDTIRKAAQKYGLDPLLLVAMIYQESHFDPYARSKTGVRGLLQISQTTARELGIPNRMLPEASIMGGANYLRGLIDRLTPLGPDPWNRLFFALGAYNQGIGHVRDAIRLTKKLGHDAKVWREVKKVFPLLSYRKYYTKTTYGYCRGIEAVDYVESIRYYYYYLTGLVRLARPEGKNLAILTSQRQVNGT